MLLRASLPVLGAGVGIMCFPAIFAGSANCGSHNLQLLSLSKLHEHQLIQQQEQMLECRYQMKKSWDPRPAGKFRPHSFQPHGHPVLVVVDHGESPKP